MSTFRICRKGGIKKDKKNIPILSVKDDNELAELSRYISRRPLDLHRTIIKKPFKIGDNVKIVGTEAPFRRRKAQIVHIGIDDDKIETTYLVLVNDSLIPCYADELDKIATS